jgi:hypothetical protein
MPLIKRHSEDESMSKASVVIVFFIILQTLTFTAYAQNDLELQQKCSKAANDLIGRIGNPFTFNAHYSKKLGGCFARAAFYEHAKDGAVQGTTYLYNVPDGKIIGFLSFIGSQSSECWVGKTKCKSADEFDDLIAPYIEH